MAEKIHTKEDPVRTCQLLQLVSIESGAEWREHQERQVPQEVGGHLVGLDDLVIGTILACTRLLLFQPEGGLDLEVGRRHPSKQAQLLSKQVLSGRVLRP